MTTSVNLISPSVNLMSPSEFEYQDYKSTLSRQLCRNDILSVVPMLIFPSVCSCLAVAR